MQLITFFFLKKIHYRINAKIWEDELAACNLSYNRYRELNHFTFKIPQLLFLEYV